MWSLDRFARLRDYLVSWLRSISSWWSRNADLLTTKEDHETLVSEAKAILTGRRNKVKILHLGIHS